MFGGKLIFLLFFILDILPAFAQEKHFLQQEDVGYVNVLRYAPHTLTTTTINAALSDLAGTKSVLLLAPGTWTISSNITIPRLLMSANTIVSVDTGMTLTISEWFDGGGMFTGAGTVSTPKMPAVTPEDFGAVTGVDAANALRLAMNSGAGIVHLRGAYTTSLPVRVGRSNIRIDGGGSLTGLSTLTANDPTNRGMLVIGESPTSPFPTTAVSNVRIQDILLDAGTYAAPLYITSCTGCVVSNIVAQNSSVGVIRGYTNTSLTVEYSRVFNGNGVFGDGIYCGGCYEFRAIGNYVYNYTRIGIVSEAEGATKSTIFWAVNNTVAHAHDATGGQNNAGIWAENTYVSHIINNVIGDQWNSPPDIFSARCIQLNDMQGGGTQTFDVQGNILSGCLTGIGVAPNSTSTVRISQTQISKGTVAAMIWGILIASGGVISIDGLQLGDNVWTGGGGILVNISSADDIRNLTIRDVQTGVTAAPTYASGGADIIMYGTSGGGLQDLTIAHVQRAKLVMSSLPAVNVSISDSTLISDGDAYLLHASAYGLISNCIITQQTAGSTIFRALPTATTKLSNVICHACTPQLNNGNIGSAHIFQMDHVTFDTGGSLEFNGEFVTDIRNSTFLTFPTGGAITGNTSSGYGWVLRVRDTDFSNAAGNIPIVMTTADATAVFAQGNTWNGTADGLIFGLSQDNLVGMDVITGSGIPEGHITARIGTIYRRGNGAAGTTLCVKESGSYTNTGWVCK